MNHDYIFRGMNLICWSIWALNLFWMFVLPFDIHGQRNKKASLALHPAKYQR